MQRKEIQRGDLFYYDFGKREGSVQSGERPVTVSYTHLDVYKRQLFRKSEYRPR